MNTSLIAFVLITAALLAAPRLSAQPPELVLVPSKLNVAGQFSALYAGIDSVKLPRGFSMNVFYAGLLKPRFFAWSPSGVLHVVDMVARAVYALPDKNGDGVADTAIVVASPVDSAHSLAFYNNALYVTEARQVKRFTDTNGDGIYETMSVFIDNIHATGVFNHYTRTLLIDTVGKAMYVSVGASCNACREVNAERAAILRFNLDGTGRSVFATGLRNALGLAVEPTTGRLWAANADRNGLGETVPEEVLTTVPQGSFHGFPFAYSASPTNGFGSEITSQWDDFAAATAAPEYQTMMPLTRADSDRVASMKTAEVLLPAHSTPMGIQFYTGRLFPAFYRNAAFVAVHGSYDQSSRKKAVGYNVMLMKKDVFSGKYHANDFLTGFLTDSAAYKHWSRPCGIGVSPNDELFVSSDAAIGALYRITYTPPVELSVPLQNDSFLSSVLPNPVASSLEDVTIEYAAPEAGVITCLLYDARGGLLAQHEERTLPTGRGRLQLLQRMSTSVPQYASGAYFYRLMLTASSGAVRVSSGRVVIVR